MSSEPDDLIHENRFAQPNRREIFIGRLRVAAVASLLSAGTSGAHAQQPDRSRKSR